MNGKPWLDAIENGGAVLGFYGWLEVAHVSVYFGLGIMELCSPMTIPIPSTPLNSCCLSRLALFVVLRRSSMTTKREIEYMVTD